MYSLKCSHDNKKNAIVCSIEKEENGKFKKYAEYDIQDSDTFTNRVILDILNSRHPIECEMKWGELSCWASCPIPPKQTFPKLCHSDSVTHKLNCGLDIPEQTLNNMTNLIKKANDIKPGFAKLLIDNNVRVLLDEQQCIRHDMGGCARCSGDEKEIVISPHNSLNALFHEWAHCKEDIEREKKGLPPLSVPETGHWKVIEVSEDIKDSLKTGVSTSYQSLPIGHEARAVHFAEKMKRKYS